MPDIAIPDTSEALATALMDETVLAQVATDEATLKQFLTDSVVKITARDSGSIAEQVKDQANKVMAELLEANGFELNAKKKAVARPPLGQLGRLDKPNPLAWGAPLDGPDASFHNVLLATLRQDHIIRSKGNESTFRLAEKMREVTAAYSSEIGSDGGFLLPEETRSQIMSLILKQAIIRPRITSIPMNTATLQVPMFDVTTHGDGTYFGGVQVYWQAEAATMVESQARLGAVKLEPQALTGLTRVPMYLLDDAGGGAIDALFTRTFPDAMAQEVEYQLTMGNGVNYPLGYQNAAAKVEVAKESGQAASSIYWQNIVKMYSRMLPESAARAIWLVPPNALPELYTMALSVGTGGSAIYVQSGADNAPGTLLGRPVFVSQNQPSLGTAGDIAFIDPSFILGGDRQAITMASTDQEQWTQNMVSYKLWERFDARPWIQSDLTPRNGQTETLSPFVTLAARA